MYEPPIGVEVEQGIALVSTPGPRYGGNVIAIIPTLPWVAPEYAVPIPDVPNVWNDIWP